MIRTKQGLSGSQSAYKSGWGMGSTLGFGLKSGGKARCSIASFTDCFSWLCTKTLPSQSRGNVITLDPCTENRRCLDFARLAIHTSALDAIRRTLKVKIDENLFHSQVMEEYPYLFSSSGSFDINRDFILNHPFHQSNSNSFVEESIHSDGKTQTRLPEIDDRRSGKESPKIHIATGTTGMTVYLEKYKNELSQDEAMNDLGDPVCIGSGNAPRNHNDLTKGNLGSLPHTTKVGQLLLDLVDILDEDSSVAQDALGSIYPEEINELEEGPDGFPIQNLEINVEEPIQN
ncbi:hypothetical protein Ancab_029662 [Ancistrocladus abbreviatus]